MDGMTPWWILLAASPQLDLGIRTDVPLAIGVAADVQFSSRIRAGIGVGMLPPAYVDLANEVAQGFGWYDAATAQLVRDSLDSALVLHPTVGFVPFADHGLVVDAGLAVALLGGKNTAANVLAGLLGRPPVPTERNQPELEASSVVGLATVRVGWRFELPERFFLRFDVGGAFTVFSATQMKPPPGARAVRAYENLARAGETYLDDTLRSYLHTATVGAALGVRFDFGSPATLDATDRSGSTPAAEEAKIEP